MSTYGSKTDAEQIAKDLHSQIEGKIILTTGVTPGGLGASFVNVVAAHSPKLLILAGRNLAKVSDTAAAVTKETGVATRALELDLASQQAVRKAAAEVNGWSDVEVIDVLMNNAAIMAAPYSKTVDGLESQFGTNHIVSTLVDK